MFGDDLRDHAARGRIRLIERHTRADGRLKPADVEELVPDLFDRQTWACGPNDMLDDLETHWADSGAAFMPAVILVCTKPGRTTVTVTPSGRSASPRPR